MEYKNRNGVSGQDTYDMEAAVSALLEMISGIHHCCEALNLGVPDENDEIFMAAYHPGKPVRVIPEAESYDVLPCFGESDMIAEAPEIRLLMSYDAHQILKVGEQHYLIGNAIFYEVDEEGNDKNLTAADIYRIQEMVARRSMTLCADGRDFPALLLD